MKNDIYTNPVPIEGKVLMPDVLIDEKTAKLHNSKLEDRARPRRRINYVKKILNDDFLMSME